QLFRIGLALEERGCLKDGHSARGDASPYRCWAKIRHPFDTQDLHNKFHCRSCRSWPSRNFLAAYFDPETTRVMGIAFAMAREALQLGGRDNLLVKESPK